MDVREVIALLLVTGFAVGCGPSVNVDQERETLMRLDREWAASVNDLDKFMSYYAADATIYAPGAPMARGTSAIRETLTALFSAPGFSLEFGPTKADVGASGDVGYTAGTYQATMSGTTEKGKYIEVWKKQADGQWKVMEDIFNADAPVTPPVSHVMVSAAALQWADAPPSLPPGMKMAVVSGDPSKPGPFVLRAQVPAGYKIPPHWHPTDENLTILSGTVALGMGDTWDEAKMQAVAAGGFIAIPLQMRHSFLAKTAATFQLHGPGPFAITYVNPADDPSQAK
jgi:ketosteroid isomerase-like protein/quercetin dioxygenase-like cupin family protein